MSFFPGTNLVLCDNGIVGCLDAESSSDRDKASGCVCGNGRHYNEVVGILEGRVNAEDVLESCELDRITCKKCGQNGMLMFLACHDTCRLTDTLFCPSCKRTILVMPSTKPNSEV